MTTIDFNYDAEQVSQEISDADPYSAPHDQTDRQDNSLTPDPSVEIAPMPLRLQKAETHDLKPKITVFGVGGGGGNAVSNMIVSGLDGVKFVAANTDAQALSGNRAENKLQLGASLTQGLGAGSLAEVGAAAAEEVADEIAAQLEGAHMVFITAGMGGGTGTGAAPVIARIAKEMGILTVAVVTKPFGFEGAKRMKIADEGIRNLERNVDTLIIIPNQNLFRVANEKTTFGASFCLADEVLHKGVACITDLIIKEGLINLDFADVRTVMKDMGKAMMGTGEAEGEERALRAAEAAIANPLLDEVSMRGAKGLLVSIQGGEDLGLYEVDEAASYIRSQVDHDAVVIVGTTLDDHLKGKIKVSVVATGLPERSASEEGDEPETYHYTTGSSGTLKPAHEARPEPEVSPSSDKLASDKSDAVSQNETPDDYKAELSIAASLQADLMGVSREGESTNYMIDDQAVMVRPFTPEKASGKVFQEQLSPVLTEEVSEPRAPYIPPAPSVAGRPMPSVNELPIIAQRQLEKQTDKSVKGSGTESVSLQSLLNRFKPMSDEAPSASHQTETSLSHVEPALSDEAEAGGHEAVAIPAFLRKQTG